MGQNLNDFQTSFDIFPLGTMTLINSKRKRIENTHDDKVPGKSHKRNRSNHAPLSSSNHQPSDLAGDDFLANNPRAKFGKKAAKPKQTFDEASHSSEPAPAIQPPKAGTSEKINQKQVSSSEGSSLDEGTVSTPGPTDAGMNAVPKIHLVAPSVLPMEEVGDGLEDGPESEEDDEEENEDEKEELNNKDDDDDDEEEGDQEGGESYSSNEEGGSSDNSLESASDAEFDSHGESHTDSKKKETVKADNPSAFASSMAGILSYKLTKTQRANPILVRSADAKEADETLLDMKLEKKAKAEMKKEKLKKEGMGSGYAMSRDIHGEGVGDAVISVLPMNDASEKALRKTAEKGVVKMFNAFASVREKAAEAQRLSGSKAKKEEKATEMSKEGWLEYIGHGGKGKDEEKGKEINGALEEQAELEKEGKGKHT